MSECLETGLLGFMKTSYFEELRIIKLDKKSFFTMESNVMEGADST
jgi:hypothetical protein